MWAKIEDASITGLIPRPKSLTIGDVQYPHNIFGLWSVSELEAIGIYEVTVDNTNLKDQNYYTNTTITYAYDSGAATGSYDTATAKDLDQLKDKHKESINREAYGALQDSDWLVIRAAEGGTAVPSAWTTYRAAVRTKSNDMETLIDAAANVDALAALYVESGDPLTRPLGEWPSKPE
jgi:hypothetical protein